MLLSIISFLLILSLLVLIHELGHYLFARIFGVRVLEFGIGFGPRILSKKTKKTEFRINSIPIGGYVKMAGDDLETVSEEIPKSELFNSKTAWQRFLITFSGPLFSIIAGFLVFALAGAIWGFPEIRVERVSPDSPAYYAGIRENDRIISVDGRTLIQNQSLTDAIRKGEPIEIAVARNGSEQTLKADPALFPQEALLVIKDFRGDVGEELSMINGAPVRQELDAYTDVLAKGMTARLDFASGETFRGTVEGFSLSEERYALGFYFSTFKPTVNKDFGDLRKGDTLVRVAHMPIEDGVDLSLLAQVISIDENMAYLHFSGKTLEWHSQGFPDFFDVEVLRNGTRVILEMPRQEFVKAMTEPNFFEQGFDYWYPENPFQALGVGVRWAQEMLVAMVRVLSQLFSGGASFQEFTGPVGLVSIVGQATRAGLRTVFILVGIITLNLGVINLLPLPALDGGRMVLALIEMIVRKRIPPRIEAYIHAIGFFLLMGLIIYITMIDIGRIL